MPPVRVVDEETTRSSSSSISETLIDVIAVGTDSVLGSIWYLHRTAGESRDWRIQYKYQYMVEQVCSGSYHGIFSQGSSVLSRED